MIRHKVLDGEECEAQPQLQLGLGGNQPRVDNNWWINDYWEEVVESDDEPAIDAQKL